MRLLHKEIKYCIYPYEITETHWYDITAYKEVVVTRVDITMLSTDIPAILIQDCGKYYQVHEHYV